jgi:hypothetical protein
MVANSLAVTSCVALHGFRKLSKVIKSALVVDRFGDRSRLAAQTRRIKPDGIIVTS